VVREEPVAIYPYRCEECNREWEEIQSPLSDHTSVCEGCGRETKLAWSRLRISQNTHFRAGYDWSFGKYFSSQRERDDYRERERPNYKAVDPIPKGKVVRRIP
jgi:DNA-directed RNA polymerase subunit RPC12/RpoP